MLLSKLKAIDRKIRAVGVVKTIGLILIHARNLLFYRRYLIYWMDLRVDVPTKLKGNYELTVREINNINELQIEDMHAIKNYAGERYIKTIEERLAENWTIYIGYVSSMLAGAVWVLNDFSEFKSHNLPFIDRSVSIIDCWTVPDYRGKGVYPFLLEYVFSSLKKKHFDKVFIEVNEKNHSSIRGIVKAGFERYQ